MEKPFYQSKTLWFNVLVIVLAIATQFGFSNYKPNSQDAEIISIILATFNIILRFATSKPIAL